MIIVTGSVLAKTNTLDELIAVSLEHTRRSRTEAGCLLHTVHQDYENPLRLVFVEEWSDRDSLAVHFAEPASRAFVKAASALAAESHRRYIFMKPPLSRYRL
ncbi:MAG: antibiotic biosynthesis monooxygenase [Deltaproteobacteria bacterium RBG_19FT_COMBO_43_11]|nr:MAG: antibiotic biosynthesis monooxygenase [Deltaproteobacteria bacterium RBG_16_44_11]OGP90137.1 MAG: antibiotic biosynthesis monooxygenase [Deltaproteobacteria bacterium RBG_19FT_COMBO_43_11]